jgi:outer membrane protein assembly factor BamA
MTAFAVKAGLVVALAVACFGGAGNAQAPAEHIGEIRVHGNVAVGDDDVLRIAGLAVGGAADAQSLQEAERRLKKSGKFETIEIRKRYRSIDDTSEAAIILFVHEPPEGEGSALTRPLRRLASGKMFQPVFHYRDGYGLTYGFRASAVNTLGLGERWSTPLTWGGERSARIEVSRPFANGPVNILQARFGIASEVNPHFAARDRRISSEFTAGRSLGFIRLSTETALDRVRFGTIEERLWTTGGTVTIDTRGNPAFPANAVYLTGGWRALWSGGRPAAGVALGDARGYWRPERHVILAGRLRYEGSNRILPDYEKLLVGGAWSLRGKRAGTFAGDRTLALSGEVRIPFRSPIRLAQTGATIFMDAAKAFDAGQSPSAVPWERSVGVGLFTVIPLVKINIHAAKPLDGGPVRSHLSFGFTF